MEDGVNVSEHGGEFEHDNPNPSECAGLDCECRFESQTWPLRKASSHSWTGTELGTGWDGS